MPIEIHDDGSVIVPRQSRDRSSAWEEILAPGETERAAAMLGDDELAQVQAVWTDDVVAAWRSANPDYVAPPVPEEEPPTEAERLAAIENALLSGEEADRQRVRDNVQKLRGSTQQRG